jgi:hypothetical protein
MLKMVVYDLVIAGKESLDYNGMVPWNDCRYLG